MEDKQIIRAEDVGSLEDVLGRDDPLFQPEPKQEEQLECAECGSYEVVKSVHKIAGSYTIYNYHCNNCEADYQGKKYIEQPPT